MKFCDETIKQFLGELESDLPAPGGGSVAGLIAALSGAIEFYGLFSDSRQKSIYESSRG